MDLHKLEVFCKVVELKSFTRTAEAVLLSQPTVSEHIRSLENELDQKLLDRLSREVTPTPAGRLLFKYARKILRLHNEALQAMEQYSGNLIGRIMIGCGTIPGTYILPSLVASFRRLYPTCKATLYIGSSRIIDGRVLDGEFELGIVGAKWNEDSLNWQEIFSDQLTLVVHPDHPWAVRKKIEVNSLIQQPFIFREQGSGTRKVIGQLLAEKGIKEVDLTEVAEIGSTTAVKEAVKAGTGVAILSQRAVQEDIACGRLVAVQIKGLVFTRPFYLITRKKRALSPVAAVFYDYLMQAAGLNSTSRAESKGKAELH